MTGTDLLVGLAIAIGVVGTLVPLLPGSLLVVGAVLIWALEVSTPTGWVVFAVATTFIALGTILKYAVPGKRLKDQGVPGSTLLFAAVLGIVGFFVIPVVGLVLGFVLGIYLAERRRLPDHAAAWTATVSALKSVGLAVLIELCASVLAALTWVVGVVVS